MIFIFTHKSSKYSLTIHESTIFSLFLSLSQVCSRWRKTIHSRPSLCASISISTKFIGALAECRHITKIHLENAGSHPLRIELNAHNMRSTSAVDILGMIIPELQRCEEFEFYGEWSVLATAAQCNSSFTFPHLRTLITGTPLKRIRLVPPAFPWFARALKNAPKLTTVNTPGTVPPEVLPCHQLTTVYVRDLNITQIAHTLRSCPNMKNLDLQSLMPWADQNSPPNVTVHSSLRELTIHTFQYRLAKIVGLLARLSLPELQTFKLGISRVFRADRMQSSILPSSAVIPNIQHFSASLQKLVLVPNHLTVHPTFCRDILQICPNLRCFAIRTNLGADNQSDYILPLIQSLMITDVSQDFLAPKLKELYVHECGSRMTTDYATEFLDMVESRSTGIRVSRLMNAVLKYSATRPGSKHLNSHISDSSIAERVNFLSRKGIRCAIGVVIVEPWITAY